MAIIHQPHDKFFKEMFGNIAMAKDFMTHYLPSEVLRVVDLETLTPEKEHYIEDDLKESFSDLLFRANINGREGYLYFLFEHKSYPSKRIAIQLLHYMVRIWDDKAFKEKKDKIPIIIPMAVYHGKESWNIGLRLSDLMEGYEDLPQEMKKYIPEYEYLIYDLSGYTDDEIKGDVQLRIVIKILRAIFKSDEEFFGTFKEAVEVLDKLEKQEKGIEYFKTFIYYILNARKGVTLTEIYDLVKEVSVERSDEIMTIAEELLKEGMEKGILQGMEKGILQGIEKGMERGMIQERKKLVKNLFAQGLDISVIAKATELSEEEVKNYLN